MTFGFRNRQITPESGCKIKVKRDKLGRVSSVETNGRCSKEEVQIFKDQVNLEEKSSSDKL